MTSQIRVLIADDHPLYRDGVARTLEAAGHIEVVAEAASASEAIAAAERTAPDLALLDISMPGDGLSAALHFSERFPDVTVCMLTVAESDDSVMTALKAGAKAYILKGVGGDDLISILTEVHKGGSYISPFLAARIIAERSIAERNSSEAESSFRMLSEREEGVLQRIADGMSNREIGEELGLHENTVKYHVTNLLQKLGVRNRTQAAVEARKLLRE